MNKDFIILRSGYNQAVRDIIDIINKCNSKSEIKKLIEEKQQKTFDITPAVEKFSATIKKYYDKKNNIGCLLINQPKKNSMIILDLNNSKYFESIIDVEYLKNNFEFKEILQFDNFDFFNFKLTEILKNFEKTTS